HPHARRGRLRRARGPARRPRGRGGPPRDPRHRRRGSRARRRPPGICGRPRRPACQAAAPSPARGGGGPAPQRRLRARRSGAAERPRVRRAARVPGQRPDATEPVPGRPRRAPQPGAARTLRRARPHPHRPGSRPRRLRRGPRAVARASPPARPLGGREDDRTALRDRPYSCGDGAAHRLPGAHAEWRALRPGRRGSREPVKRAVVTLAHPAHAGMLRALGLLEQAAPAHGRHLIAPSADSLALARRALGDWRPGTRARVVYNGMDVARLMREAAAPTTPGLVPNGVPTIGMVGNLDERKNPALLVEALAAVRTAVPAVRALLVGAFPDAAYAARVDRRVA